MNYKMILTCLAFLNINSAVEVCGNFLEIKNVIENSDISAEIKESLKPTMFDNCFLNIINKTQIDSRSKGLIKQTVLLSKAYQTLQCTDDANVSALYAQLKSIQNFQFKITFENDYKWGEIDLLSSFLNSYIAKFPSELTVEILNNNSEQIVNLTEVSFVKAYLSPSETISYTL